MPHEIDTTTGRPAIFVVGTPPWHGLGQVIEKATTSQQAIELAGLDWQVDQWPLVTSNLADIKPVPDYVANVRTDTKSVLGVVGSGYRVFQNAEAFDFMDSLVGDKLAMYETAGSLKGGRKVWMLARIPREYRAGPDDLIKPYVLLTNSHDGSGSLRMIPTSIRVVCQNTLNLALNSAAKGEGLSIRHHASLEQRVIEARQKLGVIVARFDQFDQELHAMLSKTLRRKQVANYFESLLPPAETDREKLNRDKTLNTFFANLDNDRNSLRGIRHTAWAAYNAVSEWTDHGRRYRGDGDLARRENRLNSIWFGGANDIKQSAWQKALRLAGAN